MKPIAKMSTRDQVIAALRKAIFKGDFKPGEELIQEDVAKKLEVSRMPVREAFQVLEREGLLITNQNRRMTVKGLTKEDITDHYDIRAMLEGEAAARACMQERDLNEFYEVQSIIEKAVSENDVENYVLANEHFHRLIWETSGSERLQVLSDQLWNGLPPHLAEMHSEQMVKSVSEHKDILDAISIGDQDRARITMENHVRRSMLDFLDEYKNVLNVKA